MPARIIIKSHLRILPQILNKISYPINNVSNIKWLEKIYIFGMQKNITERAESLHTLIVYTIYTELTSEHCTHVRCPGSQHPSKHVKSQCIIAATINVDNNKLLYSMLNYVFNIKETKSLSNNFFPHDNNNERVKSYYRTK